VLIVVVVVRRRRRKHDRVKLLYDDSTSMTPPSRPKHGHLDPESLSMRSVGTQPGTPEQDVLVLGRAQWREEDADSGIIPQKISRTT